MHQKQSHNIKQETNNNQTLRHSFFSLYKHTLLRLFFLSIFTITPLLLSSISLLPFNLAPLTRHVLLLRRLAQGTRVRLVQKLLTFNNVSVFSTKLDSRREDPNIYVERWRLEVAHALEFEVLDPNSDSSSIVSVNHVSSPSRVSSDSDVDSLSSRNTLDDLDIQVPPDRRRLHNIYWNDPRLVERIPDVIVKNCVAMLHFLVDQTHDHFEREHMVLELIALLERRLGEIGYPCTVSL